ncbi:ribosome small subunit-dependent GTPase A [Acidimicrobiia bacterium EGI L10123]|uniref:ribosome small subunit-dependent GTPase A n=1 Tax=Salinilacustrithrix flava TaxID=2957203 RepID=UPI003D7C20E2|nr:ribosome small subunit-dependent GTPase A [Acidimicrobiia bacterium EGI L10123]
MSTGPALEALGWDESRRAEVDAIDAPGGIPGRVVRQDRGWVQVARADGVHAARTRADRVGTPVVGDWVVVVDDEVAAVLERRGVLRRADPVGEGEQVLAANLDRVLVVAGLDRPVKAGRIQRAAAQAWDAGAEPTVVLTKADLVPDAESLRAEVAAEHPGTDVVAVSSRTGEGIDELARALGGDTVVLLGESGAGKSSLLNALAGAEVALTGDVRAFDAKGRHTTTRRELHLLPGGGIVVDTPGIRAIGLFVDPEAIDAAFSDIDDLSAQCRFNDCTHDHEPGCAVRAAVEAGELSAERLAAFGDLHAEAEWARRPEHERRKRRP